jgi:hypothetical protein
VRRDKVQGRAIGGAPGGELWNPGQHGSGGPAHGHLRVCRLDAQRG